MESPAEPHDQMPPEDIIQAVQGVVVRFATQEDVPIITRIQNQGIEDRIATVDTRAHTLEEQMEWFRSHGKQEPIMAADYKGGVIGWASLSRFSHRSAYHGIKELSIYVERGWRGKGVGSILLTRLLQMAPHLDIYKIVLNTLPFNRGAIVLYRKFGFRTVGVWKNQGKIDNRWVDVLLMEKHLNTSGHGTQIGEPSTFNMEEHQEKEPPSSMIVVKIGGSTLGSHDTILDNLVTLHHRGIIPVVVHGGGKVITDWMAKQGVRPRFVRGLRVTDDASLKIVVAVLTGLVNKELVTGLVARGAKAIGISGVDGGLLQARIADPSLGLVGRIDKVNPEALNHIIASGAIPVIAPIAINLADSNDSDQAIGMLNINADTAAGEIAAALGARQLIFLTDVGGIRDSSKRLIPRLTRQQAMSLIHSGTVSGGMTPKLEACLKALEKVPMTQIIDGRRPGALLDSIEATDVGTTIR